ncbi:uncharacterized protein EI90DRAFT_3163656 [Cantharellus anzutake]|uniref:uncharacterized protein n=1 Tax=Cantharellus anzutake TaxID=1750568 RepID=UPI001904AB6C|nr:uncharacterized protein EI90DRAFT_3163656 [Cantharellus anzutake]KAF8343819.1 hypothetical protein EI90DRAFT_3163656 [Cantharellus anzutake]
MDNGPKQLGSVSTAIELWTLLAATPGSALLPMVSKPRGPKATSTPDGPGSSTTQQHRPQQDHPPYYTLGGVHHYAAMISRIDPTPESDTRYRTTPMTQGGLPVGKRLPKSAKKKLGEIGVPNQQLHSVFDYSSRKDRERLQEPMIAQAVL